MARKIILLIMFVSMFASHLISQIKGFSPTENNNFMQEEFSSRLSDDKVFQTKNLPIGNLIDPKFYFVGPGDIIAVQNLTTSISNQYVRITPESTILLPRIGEIDLKGKTLAETRQLIIEAIKSRNDNALVYVSLFQPRMVVVTLKGNLDVKGTFTIPASYRVSTAIKLLNQVNKNDMSYDLSKYITNKQISKSYTDSKFNKSGLPEIVNYSDRNIIVLHNEGKSTLVDIEEAAVTGNILLDPYVRENDIIVVPANPIEYPEITVSGSVIRPVRLPYKPSDNLQRILKFTYGFTPDADISNITINYPDGNTEKLTINENLEVTNGDFEVKAGMSIIVGQKSSENNSIGIVSVQGAVNKPGSYVISSSIATLYDVIEEAGGFTDKAYLPLAYILRNSREFQNINFTQWNIADNFKYSDLKLEDTTRFFMDVNYKKPIVSCDFVSAFLDSNENHNIKLNDGDLIVIPTNPGTVYVYGQVNNPGYIAFQPNKNLKWYIEKAGGYAVSAEKARARIINGRTKVWHEGGDNVYLHAGDEIYVPQPPDYPPGIELQTYAVIASAVTSLIALLNIILIFTR